GVLLSPLQILSFYNGLANDGEMVKPIFRKISNSSNNKIILNPSISSQSTIKIAKSLLYDVVNKDGGTANNIRSSSYKIAGKTGTAQVDYTTENVQYISSFVGYFPADNPKYSCIVVIHKPNKSKGYYGSTVAAPVFKKISDKIHSLTPINFDLNPTKIDEVYKNFENDELIITSSDLSVIRGKSFNKVLPLLENMGYEVISRGKGILVKNYKIKSKNKVEVELV
ncbi:MAG: penicillin-binding protein, partial [Flavobacteriales bacterium]